MAFKVTWLPHQVMTLCTGKCLKTAVCVQSSVRRSYTMFRILTDHIPSVERTAVKCQSKLAYTRCGTTGPVHYRTAAEHTPADGHTVNRATRATVFANGRNSNHILIDCSVSLTNTKKKLRSFHRK